MDSVWWILAVVFCLSVSIMFDLYCWQPDVRELVGNSIDAIFCFDGVNCSLVFLVVVLSSWPKVLVSVPLKSWLNFQQRSAVSYRLVSAFRTADICSPIRV